MTPTRQLELEITQAIGLGLRDLGFEKRKFRFSKRIDKDRLGWCALNVARKHLNGIGINAVVGLAFEPVESLIERALPERRPGTTFYTSIGYLTPERRYLEWIFPLDRSIDMKAEANKIVNAVALYGVPFMNQFPALDTIIEALEQFQFIDRESALDRLPILYQLAGEQEKATVLLQDRWTALSTRDDLAAKEQKKLVAMLMDSFRGSNSNESS